ncbi:MAG TPA: isocitrate lyase/phosphoenolpyruvate mutase family protein [Vicinamibacterales bacterium]|nr:isocitrate lyase/phosphoenolpyruvate mutase family protein [Vicinamibacterales bacterium]
MPPSQLQKAHDLLRRHAGPPILVLPNAWDAASARVFEAAGFPALATTSAGIAAARGYPDGAYIPRDDMIAVIARIAAAVDVPVTADIEHGYGGSVAEVVQTVEALLDAGAVGLNLEDAVPGLRGRLEAVGLQTEKIRAIRDLAVARAIPLVINARTDVFLDAVGDPAGRFDESVRRARAYRDAGADCLFVPGVRDAGTIERLVRAIGAPVNILAGAGAPPVAELARLGVARVSVGSGPMRATLGLLERIAVMLRDEGRYDAFVDGSLEYAAVNRLMADSAQRLGRKPAAQPPDVH